MLGAQVRAVLFGDNLGSNAAHLCSSVVRQLVVQISRWPFALCWRMWEVQ